MSKLAAIGRTNLPAIGQNLVSGIGNLVQTKRDIIKDDLTMGLLQARESRDQRKFEMEEKDWQYEHEYVPANNYFPDNPYLQKAFLDVFKRRGLTQDFGGVPHVMRRYANSMTVQQILQEDTAAAEVIMNAGIMDFQNKINLNNEELRKLQEKKASGGVDPKLDMQIAAAKELGERHISGMNNIIAALPAVQRAVAQRDAELKAEERFKKGSELHQEERRQKEEEHKKKIEALAASAERDRQEAWKTKAEADILGDAGSTANVKTADAAKIEKEALTALVSMYPDLENNMRGNSLTLFDLLEAANKGDENAARAAQVFRFLANRAMTLYIKGQHKGMTPAGAVGKAYEEYKEEEKGDWGPPVRFDWDKSIGGQLSAPRAGDYFGGGAKTTGAAGPSKPKKSKFTILNRE